MTLRRTVLLACVAALPLTAAAGIPDRPSPERLVNDFAGLFSSYETAKLEETLVAFDDSTSNQIAVVTVRDLEGYDPAQYASEIGQRWGVGSFRSDNGIVLLVKPKEGTSSGQVSIQVGYGLEGAIPDIYCKHIIDNDMLPAFREGEYFRGVWDACEELMALASGEISQPRDYDDGTEAAVIAAIVMLLVIVLLIVAVRTDRKNGGGGFSGGSGGHRGIFFGPVTGWGGSRGSGGSFGGGGGFGGFGGGSFGGGGASGNW